MRIFGDWKFVITIIATATSIFVPVWLWQTDLSSKSVSIQLISLISLQPLDKKSLPGMEVSIDGVRLVNPYLAVVKIANDGNKPIAATDFEKMIEIRLISETIFSRVRVSKKLPTDLEPEIVTEKQTVALKPTLLNPKDTIEITAITSGADPKFSSKARIIGISTVSLVDNTKTKTDVKSLIQLFALTLMLFIAGMIVVNSLIFKGQIYIRPRAAIFIGFIVFSAGTFALLIFLNNIGNDSFWYYMMSIFGMMIIGGFFGSIINKKEPVPETSDTEKDNDKSSVPGT